MTKHTGLSVGNTCVTPDLGCGGFLRGPASQRRWAGGAGLTWKDSEEGIAVIEALGNVPSWGSPQLMVAGQELWHILGGNGETHKPKSE